MTFSFLFLYFIFTHFYFPLTSFSYLPLQYLTLHLFPFHLQPSLSTDDIAVLHVKPPSPTADLTGSQNLNPGCLFGSDEVKRKGDLVLQTGHVIEVVTKLFLVVQNAAGKPPDVNISTE